MLAVITGANRGMGLEITRSVLAAGYDVVMVCRNVELAEKQRESLLADYPASRIDVLKVDLASLESVTGFTEELLNPARAKLTGSFCRNCHPVHLSRRITEHPMRTALWVETEALLSK